MQGPKTLLEYEDNWVTAMGALFQGERVVPTNQCRYYKSMSYVNVLFKQYLDCVRFFG